MLKIETIPVTPFSQNCRVVWDSENDTAAVIDPGGDVDQIMAVLKQWKVKCSEIWLTHSHLDHCGGVQELKEKTGAQLFGHKLEREMRERLPDIAKMYGLPPGLMQRCPEPDKFIDEGDTLKIGKEQFQIFFTPGHSPGHLVFYNSTNEVLIGGDTLFAGSIGRTDLPGGDYDTLLQSIRRKILVLPDSTQVLSGHGPDTTIGEERATNPFLQNEDNITR